MLFEEMFIAEFGEEIKPRVFEHDNGLDFKKILSPNLEIKVPDIMEKISLM